MAAVTSPLVTSLSVLRSTDKPWQEVAREAQEHRDHTLSVAGADFTTLPNDLPQNVTQIPSQLLTAEEIKITEQAPEELLSQLGSGRLSAVTVTNAFLRRAALAQKLVSFPPPSHVGSC